MGWGGGGGVGSGNFSARFVGVVSHCKKGLLWLWCTYCDRLHAWWSTQSRLATLLSSLIARRCAGLQTLTGSDLETCLLMGWWGPGALAACRARRGLLVGFLLLWCSVFFAVGS